MRTNLVGYANNKELERDSGMEGQSGIEGHRERLPDRFRLRFADGLYNNCQLFFYGNRWESAWQQQQQLLIASKCLIEKDRGSGRDRAAEGGGLATGSLLPQEIAVNSGD